MFTDYPEETDMRVYVYLFACIALGALLGSARLSASEASLLQQAQARAEAGDIAEATGLYRQAIAAMPDSAEAHAGLGGMLLVSAHYAEAIGQFQKAIGLQAENHRAFIGLSVAYLHRGQYGPARAALTEAQRLAPAKAQEIAPIIAWIDRRQLSGQMPDHQ